MSSTILTSGFELGLWGWWASMPAAPDWDGSLTAGDTQVVLPVTPDVETDVVYARYRSSGAWSAEDATFSRTGTGNITVTGLVNETSYEFILYSKNGVSGITSAWSAPRWSTPTAASLSPSGPLSLPMENLRNIVAECASFQAWVSEVGAAAAAAHVYYPAIGGPQATIAGNRPFALIDTGENWMRSSIAGGGRHFFHKEGNLLLMFEADISAGNQASHEDAMVEFTNVVGAIVTEMEALAGTSGFLAINSIMVVEGPDRIEDKAEDTEGDFYQITFAVGWGP